MKILSKPSGARNLFLLGVLAITTSVATSGIALTIYHHTGDIYLDRSRPGFLPSREEKRNEQNHDHSYTFDENAPLDDTHLKDYRSSYQKLLTELKSVERPFSSEPLSDQSLGL